MRSKPSYQYKSVTSLYRRYFLKPHGPGSDDEWCFTPLSTVFKLYRNDERLIMKGAV